MEVKILVLQGSILAPLIFNISFKDLLLNNLRSFIGNFTDGGTLYRNLKFVSGWFESNHIIIISGKLQFTLHGKRKPVKIENEELKVGLSHSKKDCAICFIESPLKS